MFVLDASLIGENAYFIKQREEEFKDASIKDILLLMCSFADIVYFSSRKVSSTRGGGICTNSKELMLQMRDLGCIVRRIYDLWRYVGTRNRSHGSRFMGNNRRNRDQPIAFVY
jgi:tryptophanase